MTQGARMLRPATGPQRGFTMVELLITVAIVGVLAGLASYGVRKYTAASKSVEAVTAVGAISRAVRIAAQRDRMSSDVLAAQTSTTSSSSTTSSGDSGKVTGAPSGKGGGDAATVEHDGAAASGLCASSEPVPASLDSIKGRKYQPAASDYASGDKNTGWACLAFTNSMPQYYQYRYRGGSGGPVSVTLPKGGSPRGLSAESTWSASAQGDLDGDGVTSWFVMEGAIEADGRILMAPAIGSDQPAE